MSRGFCAFTYGKYADKMLLISRYLFSVSLSIKSRVLYGYGFNYENIIHQKGYLL